MEATGNRLTSDEKQQHWTDDIVEAVDFSYKGMKFQATALVAITAATLTSIVFMAHYEAPYYGYLVASCTGLIFGFLVRRKRWQKRRESG